MIDSGIIRLPDENYCPNETFLLLLVALKAYLICSVCEVTNYLEKGYVWAFAVGNLGVVLH